MVVASKVGLVLVMVGFFIVLGVLCLFVTCTGWNVFTVLCAGDFCGVEARFFLIFFRGRGGVQRSDVGNEFVYLLVCGYLLFVVFSRQSISALTISVC
jgi:hypothetical protein